MESSRIENRNRVSKERKKMIKLELRL